MQQLLAGRDLHGTVTTCDAEHTQRQLAQEIIDQQGDCVMEVTKNQATFYADLETFFRDPSRLAGEEQRDTHIGHSKGHGGWNVAP